MALKAIKSISRLGFPYQTADPFLFTVYHHDDYPVGNSKDMTAPSGPGNGADFDWNKPWRFYHGDDIPGFPAHPHRGFETITATLSGEELSFSPLSREELKRGVIDHSDSKGNGARYGQGDLQWMTAGNGIVHCEMFPLVHKDTPNHTKFFQIWLNLPAKNKMVEPHFVMHWQENINHWVDQDNGAKVTVWAGEFHDAKGQAPPPESWAADEANDVAIWFIALQPRNGKVRLPAAKTGSAVNRRLYFIAGSSRAVTVGGDAVEPEHAVELDGSVAVSVANTGDKVAEFLLLQGRPIGDPVVQHGPFVMNTRAEIQQAFADYQETRFGGWQWDSDANVFPREKGRFTVVGGVESFPPSAKQ